MVEYLPNAGRERVLIAATVFNGQVVERFKRIQCVAEYALYG
jgi:hypothetical protein